MPIMVDNSHISVDPNVCSGRPSVAGTRVRVQDIYVCHELQGMTVDEILVSYPRLTLADVHAALAYYFDHRESIARDMAEERELVAGIRLRSVAQ